MPSLNVLLTKESLDHARLKEHVVVVVDTLFAMSTIVHALGAGADAVWPAMDARDAAIIARGNPGCICAGEYMAQTLPGFAAATPLALSREGLQGRSVVYCTTNGTVALRLAAAAAAIYAGALLNGAALASHVTHAHAGAPLLIICAGSAGHFSLEDFYCAGHLVSHLTQRADYEINDAAAAARLVTRSCDARTALRDSRVGRLMLRRSLEEEMDLAAGCDTSSVVARMDGVCLRSLGP